MSADVEYRLNTASQAEISGHLSRCDADFVPPLSGRVTIDAYADKILCHAERFEAWSEATLVGLVAVYLRSATGTAHVTNVSVLREWTGRGIAAALMRECVKQARAAGLCRVTLEVSAASATAIRLYQNVGFSTTAITRDRLLMTADLEEISPL